MGLMGKKLMSVEVALSGVQDDPATSDVVAQVRFTSHGRSESSRDLAALVPMTVVATLRSCRSAPTHAGPFLDICNEVTDALLACGPEDAPSFRLREVIDEPLDLSDYWAVDEESATEEMVECWLRQCMPRISDESAGGHKRRFSATLQAPRRAAGIPFVKPWSRNAFVGIQGTLATFEAAARSRDYVTTTRPVAATTRRLLDFVEEVFGTETIPGFGEATWLYMLVNAVHAADDPLSAALPSFVEGESPEVTIATTKLGRWVRESGLSDDAALREISRRSNAGESMPWDDAPGHD